MKMVYLLIWDQMFSFLLVKTSTKIHLIMKYSILIACFLMLKIVLVQGQLPELNQPEDAFQAFQKGEEFYLKGAYQEAIPFFEKATQTYGDNYDGKLIAASLHSLALLHAGQKELAYSTFIKAGELMVDGKLKTAEASLIYNLCISRYHWVYYEPDKALELSQGIEKKMQAIEPKLPTSIEIELPEYLGIIKTSKGNYKQAIEYYKQAIVAIEKLPVEARNKKLFRFDYFKLGELYQKTRASYKALNVYSTLEKRKEEIFQNSEEDNLELAYRVGMTKAVVQEYDEAAMLLTALLERINNSNKKGHLRASVYTTIAQLDMNRGEHKRAIEENTKGLKNWNRFLPPNDLMYAYKAYLNQGKLYLDAENPLVWYQKEAPEAEKDWRTALVKRGASPIQTQQGQHEAGVNLGLLNYEKATALITRFPKAQQLALRIETHIVKGDLFLGIEDYAQARVYYEEVLNLMQAIYSPKHPWVAEVASKLSQCLLAEKKYAQALERANQAINATLKEGIELTSNAIPDPSKIYYPFELLHAISAKGKVLYGMRQEGVKEDLRAVLDNYNVAVDLLNRLKRIHRKAGEKYQLSAITHQFCQQAVVTANTLYEMTKDQVYLKEIFRYAELSKSTVLLASLQDLKAKSMAGIPQDLINQEHQLKVELSYLNKELFYAARDTGQWNQNRMLLLEKDIEGTKNKHEKLLQQLEKEYPRYYQMKYSQKVVSLEEMQENLANNEAFLEYVMSDSFVLVLAITKDAVYNQYTATSLSLHQQVKNTLRYIRTQKAEKFATAGHKIYTIVLGEHLGALLKGKKLIIAPDEALHYLPFGVLPQTNDFEQGEEERLFPTLTYLIKDYPITYNYSAALFLQSKEKRERVATEKVIAWAPSFEEMELVLQEKEIADFLEELPAAQEEANLIARLFDGKTILSTAATEHAFKEKAVNFGVLHLATHGILNDDDPIFSSLILNKDETEDGILHTYELFNMQLSAEMAVLSACNSGVGTLKKGEGVMSIARGFAYAGVPNIVMSTWQVSDEATRILMEIFYKKLQEGLPKDEAMQAAKLAYLEEFKDSPKFQAPFFWGSFVVLGNPDPVSILIEYSLWDYWGYLALLLVLLLLGLGYKTFKRKRVSTK